LNHPFVIAGLDPAIHLAKKLDARVEPAYDDGGERMILSESHPHFFGIML
jgi:hypothetical protein